MSVHNLPSQSKPKAQLTVAINSEQETEEFAGILAAELKAPIWIQLEGCLGAGKTTLTRYVLRGLGHQGSVKSPTYTLVEPYQLGDIDFFHFDLYRLGEPEELDYLGIRDYLTNSTVAFVEWPSKGLGYLPNPDLQISIAMKQQQRQFTLCASSEKGEILLQALITNTNKSA